MQNWLSRLTHRSKRLIGLYKSMNSSTPTEVTTVTAPILKDGYERVLAFDIGIKNLAYCIFDKPSKSNTADISGCTSTILAWENVNLLTDGTAAPVKTVCNRCVKAAKFAVVRDGVNSFYCGRHVPADRPAYSKSDGKPYTSMPPATSLKESAAAANLGRPLVKGTPKKEDWIALLATHYALPLSAIQPVKKVTKALGASLETLHDAILAMILVDRRYDFFMSCTKVLLENQPVLKNPTMKSVQILLFATLRDNFKAEKEVAPAFHLVHAGKKVRGIEAGDAGYAARKEGGEARVRAWLNANSAGSKWDALFTGAAKKSDLADALCMCLDF